MRHIVLWLIGSIRPGMISVKDARHYTERQLALQQIGRAENSTTVPVYDVRIDHCDLHIRVTEQFLDRTKSYPLANR